MGNATSKVRQLPKTVTTVSNPQKSTGTSKVFTQRPPTTLEKTDTFTEAITSGKIRIESTQTTQPHNPNHPSLQTLASREMIEAQYDDFYVPPPRSPNEPDIPERFLTEAQKKEVAQQIKPEMRLEKESKRKNSNKWGLFDSQSVSDLIKGYKEGGVGQLERLAQDQGVNKSDNINLLCKLVDSGIISEPSFKVVVKEIKENGKIKSKMMIVKNNEEDGKSKEKIEELESKLRKSQISVKKAESPNEEDEDIMRRPKKILVEEKRRFI
ncbi:hypothetical protein DAMA08_018140 [Martiniozyma asiatica (nom. inval.)]|nr:hypothetical protein DAMA08_018140 [Martiniozyma asiatica]